MSDLYEHVVVNEAAVGGYNTLGQPTPNGQYTSKGVPLANSWDKNAERTKALQSPRWKQAKDWFIKTQGNNLPGNIDPQDYIDNNAGEIMQSYNKATEIDPGMEGYPGSSSKPINFSTPSPIGQINTPPKTGTADPALAKTGTPAQGNPSSSASYGSTTGMPTYDRDPRLPGAKIIKQ